MASRQVLPFFQTYTDLDGAPLENGYIYIGTSGLDPETNAITIYSDSALTTTVTQPVRTTGGFAMASGTQINIYANVDYSITIRNKSGALIYTSLTSLNPGGYATQAELDDTQTGAGLESDGGYTARSGTNFIDAATSLYTQGTELDTNVQTSLDGKLALSGGTMTGTGMVTLGSGTPSGAQAAKFSQIPTALSGITQDVVRKEHYWNSSSSAYSLTTTVSITDGGTSTGRFDVTGGYSTTIFKCLAKYNGSSFEGTYHFNGSSATLSGNTASINSGGDIFDITFARVNDDEITVKIERTDSSATNVMYVIVSAMSGVVA